MEQFDVVLAVVIVFYIVVQTNSRLYWTLFLFVGVLGKPRIHFFSKFFTGFSNETVELCKIFFCESVVGKNSSLKKTCAADSTL